MSEQRPRPEHHTPAAEAALDVKAQALQALLGDVLAPFKPTHEAVIDIPTVVVEPRCIADVCRLAKDDPRLDFKMLLCLAGVDYKEHLQVVYLLLSLQHEQKLFIKADLPPDEPRMPSVTSIWRAADWYEREAHDLFGVSFDGHPDLAPLLLYEGFEGYPGRKEFPFNEYQEF